MVTTARPYLLIHTNPHRDISARDNEDKDSTSDLFEFDFHALQTAVAKPGSTHKSDQPNGCFKMLVGPTFTCPRGSSCSFSHDSAVLTRSCTYWINLLQKSRFYKPSLQSRPLTHLQQSSSEGSSTDA